MSVTLVTETHEESKSFEDKIEYLKRKIEEYKDELENERQRADEALNRAEDLQNKLDSIIEDYEYVDDYGDTYKLIFAPELEKMGTADRVLEGIKEQSKELNTCYERLNMGVLSEIDEIIKITDQLIDLHKDL